MKEFYEQHPQYWEDDPDYSSDDWRAEVAKKATRLGYWDWVENQKRLKRG